MSEKMNRLCAFLLARIQEPSTWRGLVLVATAAGVALSPEQQDAIVSIGLGIAGLVGALTPDSKGQPHAE
jgi:hypothetical protein